MPETNAAGTKLDGQACVAIGVQEHFMANKQGDIVSDCREGGLERLLGTLEGL